MVEVHPHPDEAVSDAAQQLKPYRFKMLMDQIHALDAVMSDMRQELAKVEKQDSKIL